MDPLKKIQIINLVSLTRKKFFKFFIKKKKKVMFSQLIALKSFFRNAFKMFKLQIF